MTARCSGVVCELCELWVHTACVGLKASTKMLSHKNIMFLCDECLEAAKERMKASKEEKGTQTTATEICKDTKALSKVNKAEVQDMGMQTENEKDRHPRRGPAVKKMIKRKSPICIVGDSMMKNTGAHLQTNVSGNSLVCLRGARIQEVKKTVAEKTQSLNNGLLVIQGGGNDLEGTGEEETVKEVVEAVRMAEEKNLSVAVVGVMRRPREGDRYERLRRRTNARLQEEVLKLKMDWLKNKKGNVSFIDLDATLREGKDFALDGVHLNEGGNERMCRRLREWMRARSLVCMDSA